MGNFREPYDIDENGMYITESQINFFANRPNGLAKIDSDSEEFNRYCLMCQIHNLVYDLSEKDNSEGYIYWDDKKECTGIWFPLNGKVADKLRKEGIPLEDSNGNPLI